MVNFKKLAKLGKKLAYSKCYEVDPAANYVFNKAVKVYAKEHNMSTDEVLIKIGEAIKKGL